MGTDQWTVIAGGTVIGADQVTEDGIVWIGNGKIMDVTRSGERNIPPGAHVIDASGKYISPGFIDLHVHGGGGSDVMDGNIAALETMARFHARFGTTAFLATTMTASHEMLEHRLGVIRKAMESELGGAAIVGVHLEGPYISSEYKGAQNVEWIAKPTIQDFDRLIRQSGNTIKLVTLAPEQFDFEEMIPYLTDRGIISSVGHSDATNDQVEKCIRCGLSHATHLFNAMRPLHHREPGIIGEALIQRDMTVEVIVDGIHVHPKVVKLVHTIKGPEKMLLITDAIRAAGLDDGIYELGGQKVILNEGIARLSDGVLAGSTLTMNQAVRNLIQFAGIPLAEAIRSASEAPAKKLGLFHSKGSIEPGKDADLLIIDQDVHVFSTFIQGKQVHHTFL